MTRGTPDPRGTRLRWEEARTEWTSQTIHDLGNGGKSGLVPLDLVKLANKFTRLLLF